MRAVAAAALAVAVAGFSAACFNPTYPLGRPCSESQDCPDGQACDLASDTCVAPEDACTELPCRELVTSVPVQINRDLDILFVLDNSGSMAEEQASLALNFYRLTSVLENIEGGLPNVHIGIVSTDVGAGAWNISGCNADGDNGAFHTDPQGMCEPPNDEYIVDVDNGDGTRTTNYSGTLQETFACIAQLGISGCGFEQPLESMRRALDGSVPDNDGFLRDEALLAVVIVSDEDDCSTDDNNMFDPNQNAIDDPLGPLSSFRCFEFGVVCDQDADPRAPGERTNCTAREDSQYMFGVQEYIDFLKQLKADPMDVVVAGIIGDPSPVEVVRNEQDIPELVASCVSASGEADPAVRLKTFLDGFPARNTMSTICNEDLSDSLVLVAELLAGVVGSPCIHEDIDLEPNTPGIQHDCAVYESTPDGDTPIPECGNGDDPCFRFVEDAQSCSGSIGLEVDRSSQPPDDASYDVRCLLG